MTIISINQPAYLPWLGYFDRIARADCHVVLDHVQFEKNSFTNRNKILTSNGPCWLTMPVMTNGKFKNNPINEIEINNQQSWKKKHWETIKHSYGKTPYFKDYRSFFEEFYQLEHTKLYPYLESSNNFLLKSLDITTPTVLSSELNLTETKSDLVLEICKKMNATVYLSGPLGRDYLEENKFIQNGIQIVYHDYEHPIYTQHQEPFQYYLSILDLMFRHGKNSLNILKNTI